MKSKNYILDKLKPFGLVFGDIGTSPIYTLSVIFLTLPINRFNVIGVVSLIIWTLLLIPLVQYSVLAMSLSKRGEGGEIVLFEIISPLLKSSRKVLLFAVLTYIGVSLTIGDGVVTPAISILSAVEGLKLVFPNISKGSIILIASLITCGVFAIQKHGSGKVSGAFGPLMFLWFIILMLFGAVYIFDVPGVLAALNPFEGLKFLAHHGVQGLFVLAEVILCSTGVEALYADMGHLGREPIQRSLYFVLFALILNYMGQGAFLLLFSNPDHVLFGMILKEAPFIYMPFLILSLFATVIASQAMISGVFSIVYQAIATKIMPSLKISYTSEEVQSQIYVGTANKFLFVAVLAIIFTFKTSSNLAAAYGLAVTCTISLTAFVMSVIFYLKKHYAKSAIAAFLLGIDLVFLLTSLTKLNQGAYWSIVIASVPFTLIMIYSFCNKRLHKWSVSFSQTEFLEKFKNLYQNNIKIPGTALFLIRNVKHVPSYIMRTMFVNNIIYEDNILLNIDKLKEPYGLEIVYKTLCDGVRLFQIKSGYMEILNLENILRSENINEKVIFYGIEEVETKKKIWKVFSFIKKVTPSFVEFYKLPYNKLHGVTNQTIV